MTETTVGKSPIWGTEKWPEYDTETLKFRSEIFNGEIKYQPIRTLEELDHVLAFGNYLVSKGYEFFISKFEGFTLGLVWYHSTAEAGITGPHGTCEIEHLFGVLVSRRLLLPYQDMFQTPELRKVEDLKESIKKFEEKWLKDLTLQIKTSKENP